MSERQSKHSTRQTTNAQLQQERRGWSSSPDRVTIKHPLELDLILVGPFQIRIFWACHHFGILNHMHKILPVALGQIIQQKTCKCTTTTHSFNAFITYRKLWLPSEYRFKHSTNLGKHLRREAHVSHLTKVLALVGKNLNYWHLPVRVTCPDGKRAEWNRPPEDCMSLFFSKDQAPLLPRLPGLYSWRTNSPQ